MVKNRNFGQKSNFWSKIEILKGDFFQWFLGDFLNGFFVGNFILEGCLRFFCWFFGWWPGAYLRIFIVNILFFSLLIKFRQGNSGNSNKSISAIFLWRNYFGWNSFIFRNIFWSKTNAQIGESHGSIDCFCFSIWRFFIGKWRNCTWR